jgi:adenylate kinase
MQLLDEFGHLLLVFGRQAAKFKQDVLVDAHCSSSMLGGILTIRPNLVNPRCIKPQGLVY